MAFQAPSDVEFVDYIVKSLVDNPDAVNLNRSVDEMGVLLELQVDPTDMGKVIGKEGQNAQALRTLLRVFGAKENARVNLKILEPVGAEQPEAETAETNEAELPTEEGTAEAEEAATPSVDDVPTDVLV